MFRLLVLSCSTSCNAYCFSDISNQILDLYESTPNLTALKAGDTEGYGSGSFFGPSTPPHPPSLAAPQSRPNNGSQHHPPHHHHSKQYPYVDSFLCDFIIVTTPTRSFPNLIHSLSASYLLNESVQSLFYLVFVLIVLDTSHHRHTNRLHLHHLTIPLPLLHHHNPLHPRHQYLPLPLLLLLPHRQMAPIHPQKPQMDLEIHPLLLLHHHLLLPVVQDHRLRADHDLHVDHDPHADRGHRADHDLRVVTRARRAGYHGRRVGLDLQFAAVHGHPVDLDHPPGEDLLTETTEIGDEIEVLLPFPNSLFSASLSVRLFHVPHKFHLTTIYIATLLISPYRFLIARHI